ncbi:hypothetical protein KSP40_PGU015709 [Platanthera guangdongensis]|uniref:Uncharacterized protein n=1 Tax=Platanthera guangdongensis TaxID=2320717 RepID=A0ABR2LQU2_9ASPA
MYYSLSAFANVDDVKLAGDTSKISTTVYVRGLVLSCRNKHGDNVPRSTTAWDEENNTHRCLYNAKSYSRLCLHHCSTSKKNCQIGANTVKLRCWEQLCAWAGP